MEKNLWITKNGCWIEEDYLMKKITNNVMMITKKNGCSKVCILCLMVEIEKEREREYMGSWNWGFGWKHLFIFHFSVTQTWGKKVNFLPFFSVATFFRMNFLQCKQVLRHFLFHFGLVLICSDVCSSALIIIIHSGLIAISLIWLIGACCCLSADPNIRHTFLIYRTKIWLRIMG